MALPAIPIWTIRPNWRDGIRERLEWKTDVLESDNGTEQRRALRLSPRRAFEMVFNPVDQARSYFDLFLHRLVGEEFMLPLFHDKVLTTADRNPGNTSLAFDNTYREFMTDGYALLLGEDPFTFEVVEIVAQTAAGLTISALVNAWPAGTTLHPLRSARLEDESSVAAITSRVGQSTLGFTLTQANDFMDGDWTDNLEYAATPVITKAPNRREPLDLRFLRKAEVLDNETGLVHMADLADRAFTVQIHSWLLRGRQEHAEFRSMLYRLRGRQRAVWLPSFNNDLVLARPTAAASANIDVKKIGYAYTGGIGVSGRRHILFRSDAAPIAAQIAAVGAPLAATEERLVLSGPVGAILPAGRVASFLEIARLDTDAIEIQHLTDTNGVSECSTPFRSFLDERLEDDENSVPLPAGVMNDSACGIVGPRVVLPRHSSGWRYKLEPHGTVGSDYSAEGYDDSAWEVGNAPFYYRSPHSNGNVVAWGYGEGTNIVNAQDVWMRKEVTCTPGWILNISGAFDNFIRVWINGEEVALSSAGSWLVVGTAISDTPDLVICVHINETQGNVTNNYTFGDIEIIETLPGF